MVTVDLAAGARLSASGRVRLTSGALAGIQPSIENGGLLYAHLPRAGHAEIREGRLAITGSGALNLSPTWGNPAAAHAQLVVDLVRAGAARGGRGVRGLGGRGA